MRVVVSGNFDALHWGHYQLIKRAKYLDNQNNKLIVALSTDEFSLEKGKKTLMTWEQRREILEHIDMVDYVIHETGWDCKRDIIKKYSVDVWIAGSDYIGTLDYLEQEGLCRVVYLPRTEGISTTMIKESLK